MLNLMSNFSGIKIAGSSQHNTLLKAVMSGLIRIILGSKKSAQIIGKLAEESTEITIISYF